MKRMLIAVTVIFAVCLGLMVAPSAAAVRFDGATWYHSEDPGRLIVNADGHLEWLKPKGPDQVTVKLPAMSLAKVGDVAEVSYLYKTNGRTTGVPSTDPTLLSGTGDIRIGIFDSNGRGHISSDNTGYRQDTWCGYIGYLARICPHLAVGQKRRHSDAIPGKFMKRTGAWEEDVCPSLLQKAGPYGKSRDLSGFGLKLGVFSPLTLRVERTAPNTLVFSITLNDVTYKYVDDDARLQPKKIDALAMYFPNPKAYDSIVLAPAPTAARPASAKGKCQSSCCAGPSKSGSATNVIVHAAKDIFCGWPANNGVWLWGNEILVGFFRGEYVEKGGHNYKQPATMVLARSNDGGRSWTLEDPDNFVGDGGQVTPSPGGINFTDPDFAMRLEKSSGIRFFISYNRGHTWRGPYAFNNLMDHPELSGLENTSRTEYLVNGPNDCFIFMSARHKETGKKDRAFCAGTTDGGKTFNFVSWINPEKFDVRGVMPSTVRLSQTRLVTVLRRKYPGQWVDLFESNDNGANWKFLSKVADTGHWNGNPPAMVKIKDGRLCCVYGNRSTKTMNARYSADEGKTWGREFILRSDFKVDSHNDPDFGYPRLVERLDGKLVAMYYWATEQNPHHHIAATIWDPDKFAP